MNPKSQVIVVGVDFSDLGDRAFRQAYELAPQGHAPCCPQHSGHQGRRHTYHQIDDTSDDVSPPPAAR